MTTNKKRPLMGVDNIFEMQDNGYKSTVSAISEIIDNSIQANASNVDVVIIRNTSRSKDEIDEILIIDDGDGMDMKTFDKALQMSSGTRGKAKSGLGKYGQGLPNASISQTKRVEVYTYKNGVILFNHIDLDEIHKSGEAYLPDPEKRSSIDIPLFNKGKLIANKTGTIVRWCVPNRVRPKTARVLSEHIELTAGRIFRYFLNGFTDSEGKKQKCKINILVYEYNGSNYEINDFDSRKDILPFDPMFLIEKTQMNSQFPESIHPTSDAWPDSATKIFIVDYNGKNEKTKVEIKLSYCRKEERDRYGRNAGNSEFGKKYLKRNLFNSSGYDNISIIRSGREIDAGNFGFISDISLPTNRWWSVEIHIEPIIDSIAGVDNKKQQASEIKYLDMDQLSDEDTHEILQWISIFTVENIKGIKSKMDEPDSGPRGGLDGDIETPKLPPGGDSERGEPGTDDDIDDIELEKIKKEFYQWIKERWPDLDDVEINKMVIYALSIRDNHIFIKSDLGDSALFSYKVFGTKVLIEINYTHSFYQRFMKQFEDDPAQQKSLRSLRLLIGSLVNAEVMNKTMEKSLIKDRRNLKSRMSESLEDYIDDLYSS